MAASDTVVDLDSDSSPLSNELQFQDIPHSSSDALKDVTRQEETKSGKRVQTHTFTNFPNPNESEDEEDKNTLLQGDKKQPSFWTFDYYQSFFDVETHQVLHRILGSMVPNPRANYLQTKIRPNPDLYGPFWICTTLVFTTAIAGNLANYFSFGGKEYEWHYDFQKVTYAAAAVYGYWWVIPTLLYLLLWWRGSQAGYCYSEMICVYGYSLAIYIPISILWVINIVWLQWIFVLIGMTLSGAVLFFVFWPAIRDDDKKIAILVMSLIVLFHGLLAVGFKLYFFQVPSAESPVPGPTTVGLSTGEHTTKLLAQAVTSAVQSVAIPPSV